MIFLPEETQVETQYVKFKVTQDTMATFSQFRRYLHR